MKTALKISKKTANIFPLFVFNFRRNLCLTLCESLRDERCRVRYTIGGPKMSGNFVRERQRIVYIYNIHKVGNLISPDEHMTFVKHKIHRSWN